MESAVEFVSPRQAARALGVSESSLKRWCDQGLIKSLRTAGGHRRLPAAEIVRFVREHAHPLVSPELLGLPARSEPTGVGLEDGRTRLVAALLDGDDRLARELVFQLYLAPHPLSVIFDTVIAKAFHEIGHRWACQQVDVYQERRGCQITLQILFDLRRLLSAPPDSGLAMGGTIEGDFYSVPSLMAELVLRDAGFEARDLGTSIPLPSLVSAVRRLHPELFWLSVSHIREDLDFVGQYAELWEACEATGTALVAGGRALTPELRQQINYSAYCDTMQHLESFARALGRQRRDRASEGGRASWSRRSRRN